MSEGATCDLIGKFGAGPDSARLILTKHTQSDIFELTFAASNLPDVRSGTRMTVDFGPTENPRNADWTMVVMGDGAPALQASARLDDYQYQRDQTPPKISPAETSRVDRLTVTVDNRTFRLRLESMQRPMQALDQCIDRLVQSWGYDPIEQASLSERPQPANYPGSWVTTSDYPSEALRGRMAGLVWFRLDLDPEGRVSACTIQSATAAPVLQTATCDLVKSRARFKPARNAGGKPVQAYYVNKIRWAPPG